MTTRLGPIAALRAPVVGVSTSTGAVIPSRPAPAATVAVVVPTLGPAIRRTAVAARLAAPTAVMVAVVPPRHGATRGFWVGIIVAMRKIAPMGTAAAVACLPAPSAVVAVTRPTLGPATGRIAVATRYAVPAIEAVAAAPVTMAPVRGRTSGRRVAGTRPRERRPQGRAAGGRWPPVVGRPDGAAGLGVGPLRLAAAGGRSSAPRGVHVDGGTPRGRGRCAPVTTT